MPLKEYHNKRRFDRTPEPKGREHTPSATDLSYVVQKHDASRLHYDFRLELDGVLLSWAVPKGPSLDPADKRLAVHTEDHPIEYGSFEGVIPEGEYGGGTVMLWDRGRWIPHGDPRKAYSGGRLRFRLEGERLNGEWTLARMSGKGDGKNWLLIKRKDGTERSGEGEAAVEEFTTSVETGRTMDDIAEDRARVWSGTEGEIDPQSNGAAKKGRGRNSNSRSAGGRKTAGKKKRKPSAPDRAAIADSSRATGARKSPFPKDLTPQLATLIKDPPKGDDWLHEVKFDGYRLLAMVDSGKVRLISRNGKDWTSRFPPIANAIDALALDSAVLDGEAVIVDAKGRSDFQALQNAIKSKRFDRLAFYAFDLPYLSGYDLSRTPLVERKELLRAVLPEDQNGVLRYSEHILGSGKAVYQNACRLALEGVIAKKADSPYETRRTRHWLKVKCSHRQEFVVVGWTDPTGSRIGFGALLLAYHDQDGDLVYAGKVGTGFSDDLLKDLHAQLQSLSRKTSPLDKPAPRAETRSAHWVTPKLICEVEFAEWTGDGRLRHPAFIALRSDKPPEQIVREVPEAAAEAQAKEEAEPDAARPPASSKRSARTSTGRSPKKASKRSTTRTSKKATSRSAGATAPPANNRSMAEAVTVAGVRLTNPDRIVYPTQGLTKLQVAQYYERIAEHILPHIVKRPLSVVRCPKGRTDKCFFQKHRRETLPAPVRGTDVRESDGKTYPYIAIDDLPGLITLVQFGVLEIHSWQSREDRIEMPDQLVFDLDPAPGVSWEAVVEGALRTREVLEGIGLQSFCKTSGGKGLHVVVPLVRRVEYDQAKAFSKHVAELMSREEPKKYLATMSKAKRQGRIFVDYLRNGRGATSIAPYSTRARDGAPVSAPVSWDEVGDLPGGDAFTVAGLPAHLAAQRDDPWVGFSALRQSITKAMLRDAGVEA